MYLGELFLLCTKTWISFSNWKYEIEKIEKLASLKKTYESLRSEKLLNIFENMKIFEFTVWKCILIWYDQKSIVKLCQFYIDEISNGFALLLEKLTSRFFPNSRKMKEIVLAWAFCFSKIIYSLIES